jgi:hypothetical protein
MEDAAEDPERPIAIFKLGARRHMDELMRGAVFMNSLGYFASLERSDQRADPNEGVAFSKAAKGGKLSVEEDGVFHEIAELAGPLTIHDDDLRSNNVYCLHVRRARSYGIPFNLTELDFGDTAVVIKDVDEFARRLTQAGNAVGQQIAWSLVEYIDPNAHSGPMGPFRKFLKFRHQDELRFVASPGLGKPLMLDIGPIDDIALIIPVLDNVLLTRY